MYELRRRRELGFTVTELMIVVAILGILSAMAAPSFARYFLREDTRANTQKIARILSEARQLAIDRGRNQFVIFSNPLIFQNPGGGGAPQIATMVEDVDGDFLLSAPDLQRPIFAFENTHPNVTAYGAGAAAPHGNATFPPEDAAAAAVGPNLAALAATGRGSTFPNAPFNFNPTVGFNPRGIPVSLATPTNPGSGAGAVYITDNDKSVYAVILLPLGGVRVRALQPNANPAQTVWR
ncbi:MAG: Tfp pilus assembly protein FimT/FimU [Myxococcota bacterium]